MHLGDLKEDSVPLNSSLSWVWLYFPPSIIYTLCKIKNIESGFASFDRRCAWSHSYHGQRGLPHCLKCDEMTINYGESTGIDLISLSYTPVFLQLAEPCTRQSQWSAVTEILLEPDEQSKPHRAQILIQGLHNSGSLWQLHSDARICPPWADPAFSGQANITSSSTPVSFPSTLQDLNG